jgi:raffinose/stachyose/melibiose transport system substrate-binding protein
MKRFWTLALIVALCATGVFANGTKEETTQTAGQKQVTLSAYMQIDPADDQYRGHNEIMKVFAEKYPNIKIDVEYASGESFHQKFQAMAASKQIPDIFTCYGGARSSYVNETGMVLDLNKTGKITDAYKAGYNDGTFAAQGKNGELWMIPPSFAVCHVVYANDALLKKLGLTYPKTFEEWKAQVPAIRAAGYYPASMGNKDPWVVNSWLLSLFVDREGGPEWFMNAAQGKNNASFNDPQFVKSIDIIKQMCDAGLFSPGVNQMSNGEADQEFYQQKSVYLIDAGWRTSAMDSQLTDEMKKSVSMHVFPALAGEVTHDTSTATSSEGFGLNAKLSKEKLDAAWTFVDFYCGAEGAAIRAKYGEVPSYKLDLTKVAMTPMQAKFADFQATHKMGYVFDSVMNGEGVTLLNTDLQAMMLGGGLSPKEIAAKYEKWVAANDSNRM